VRYGATRVVWPASVNRDGYLTINGWARHSGWAHSFMHAYALWAGLVLLAVLLVAGYLRGRSSAGSPARVGAAVITGVATLVALGLNQLVSHAAKETRPYVSYPHALVLVAKAADYSFPSDHAVVAGAFILGLFFVHRGIAAAAVVAGLFLAFARIYVGAHYPSDVVAGLLLGGLVCAVLLALLRVPVRAVLLAMTRTPLAVLVGPTRPAAARGTHARP
jgi:undecaprenyl-diphosphatase